MKRVVITGLGTINSTGHSVAESFEAIKNGVCGIDTITLFDASDFTVQIAGEVKNFDPETVMDKKEVKKADRFIQLGIKAAHEAMIDSGFVTSENKKVDENDAARFGIISGSGIGGLSTIQKNSTICDTRGSRKISPFFIPSSLSNMLSGFISIEHNLKGPSLSHVTACAASTHAICDAFKTIALDGADRILVVGAESAVCGAGVGGFAAMKALSTRNDDPKKSSRPFDIDRDGFVMGEGAGALVIESLDSALERNAKIYCEIIGFGESGDANHITSPVVDGPLRAMKSALLMAERTLGTSVKIDYINMHGTSTPVGDKNETSAIKELFGGKENSPLVSSIKGQIGHCLGAAGAIEAIMTIKALNDGIIPPTINVENQDPECDLDVIPNIARNVELNTVMTNNFGFGGTNGSVIFKKFTK
ncbi:3-oxoacyl-[acyl-carrier-protein] synthase 2 [Aliarcobacter thereius]|uniref:3-oxoacyl-[acyl-carrier-protein] synthase 2 n=2 Tax=Aliarcobacter thereius TaxID=544718 RepID=A0A5R9H8T2_9BACT|nr:beta-ketoacyl-ACP synthase II [Aliarcobacter thereius]OCL88656.1 3-oxoacyl-[acyl-carrier-protein] synthase 2 [Aliarcobacter thereius]OCL92151.1 3-oxoacyl-[acyl-carrier-protein] synthase 2 [Aliarcobacter thereius]OCL94753.1 3-oxoacyl-[acyl-carrier-protein] synthase 2 [Aliarcobacter thereius LMG 24486]QBF15371.1 beta-ketoacyl-[acp] synthase II (KASII) [Aliarcobacter thereius LMG 24486]TLS72407.1 beta-ketoacyl-ACP synthase II [Aliarcobacter thereius]